MNDDVKYYYLEKYIFEEVRKKFLINKHIGAFDFFCIIIWKANRAKSKIALKLLLKYKGEKELEEIVQILTRQINSETNKERRLKILVEEWKFRLPMASAILTVFYPDEYTIYDTRVCGILNNYNNLVYTSKFDDLYKGYSQYIEDVRNFCKNSLNLRDKDREIWGKSFKEQLKQDIENNFKIDREDLSEET